MPNFSFNTIVVEIIRAVDSAPSFWYDLCFSSIVSEMVMRS
ncbi:Uncharacterized protein APZ42_025199 [Daphnia magna]|uniref:Uncharacterized protein n=1 Tax=Daphnia magna TaxID=35525 RepID=A0A164TD43_9CRUS|nr:Uncharacterized protein APZ42_025199 [Daphnia magna]